MSEDRKYHETYAKGIIAQIKELREVSGIPQMYRGTFTKEDFEKAIGKLDNSPRRGAEEMWVHEETFNELSDEDFMKYMDCGIKFICGRPAVDYMIKRIDRIESNKTT